MSLVLRLWFWFGFVIRTERHATIQIANRSNPRTNPEPRITIQTRNDNMQSEQRGTKRKAEDEIEHVAKKPYLPDRDTLGLVFSFLNIKELAAKATLVDRFWHDTSLRRTKKCFSLVDSVSRTQRALKSPFGGHITAIKPEFTFNYWSGSMIHQYEFSILVVVLHTHTHITSLDLSRCDASNHELSSLLLTLTHNTTIRHLGLSRRRYTGSEFNGRAVADLLASNNTISSIDLSGNRFVDDEVREIMSALSENYSLTSLDLSDTCLDMGTAEIANMIQANDTLQRIDLRCNLIGPYGLIKIAKAMQKNDTLQYLYADDLRMGPAYTKLLAPLRSDRLVLSK